MHVAGSACVVPVFFFFLGGGVDIDELCGVAGLKVSIAAQSPDP